MVNYHEQLSKAGVLLDGSGLKPSSQGWPIHYDGDKRSVVDGPFAETKELIAGYTLIQVKSREEAMEWARRFPNPAGRGKAAIIEVRQYTKWRISRLRKRSNASTICANLTTPREN